MREAEAERQRQLDQQRLIEEQRSRANPYLYDPSRVPQVNQYVQPPTYVPRYKQHSTPEPETQKLASEESTQRQPVQTKES
jgi:hypothetical protein